MTEDRADSTETPAHRDLLAEALVRLSERLTINEVETVHGELIRGLESARRLELITSELEDVDAAGLQLLIAARRSAEQKGKSVRLAPPLGAGMVAALVRAGFRTAGEQRDPVADRDGFWWGEES